MILNIAITILLLFAAYASMAGMNLIVWALRWHRNVQQAIMAVWIIANIAGVGYAIYRVWT